MPTPYIKHTINNGIAQVEFFNPKANSFESNQLHELSTLLDKLSEIPELKLILLESAGDKVFCAGAAFHELVTIKSLDAATEFFMGFGRLMLSIVNNKKIVAAAVNGRVVGGGVGLVAACDYAVSTDYSSLKLSELSIGIGPFVIEPAIRRKIGLNHFSAMCLKPTDWKTASWAKDSGLYQEVTNQSDFEQSKIKLIEQYEEFNPKSLQKIKEVLRQGTEHWKEEIPKRAAMSAELLLEESTQRTLKKLTK